MNKMNLNPESLDGVPAGMIKPVILCSLLTDGFLPDV